MADAPTTKRARARAAMTADIKRIARSHLAEHGADGLSLRAVARDLGVVSSAVYRYVASRDELLTLLIIDAYDAVGEAAERAAADGRGGAEARWVRTCGAVRAWAVAHPHDYALVYGSPVPGYAAPADTVDPALRVTRAAISVVAAAWEAGEIDLGAPADIPTVVRDDLEAMRAAFAVELPAEVVARALLAWTGTFGHLSWELFGHLHGGVTDYDAFFEVQAHSWWQLIARGPGAAPC
ncbi:MAG: WHG domain-containing protein [Acidimicrobiales bacterium]|nr:WHG domain-containing protein [Acidimicrobiales bacterium]HRW37926.1 WHG domain-containing protein [Aquihabitans sp.]